MPVEVATPHLFGNSYVLLVELELGVVVPDVVERNGRRWVEHAESDAEAEEVAQGTLNL